MAAEYTNRKIPRPASRPLETLTKIAAQNLDGYLFRIYLLSRTVVPCFKTELFLCNFNAQKFLNIRILINFALRMNISYIECVKNNKVADILLKQAGAFPNAGRRPAYKCF